MISMSSSLTSYKIGWDLRPKIGIYYPFACSIFDIFKQEDDIFIRIKILGIHSGGMLPMEEYPLILLDKKLYPATELERRFFANTYFVGVYNESADEYKLLYKTPQEDVALSKIVPVVEEMIQRHYDKKIDVL